MDSIGLFPLGLVLLPGERVPLHIFEERYKELIGECLGSRADFGIVFADDSGMRAVGTRATVLEVLRRWPDGRLDIVVEGRSRFAVTGLTEGRSFLTASVIEREDSSEQPDAEVVRACRDAYAKVVSAAGKDLGGMDHSLPLSFQVAATVDFGPEVRQQLLEMRSEETRLEHLLPLLERAAEVVGRRRAVRSRAAGNGRVG